MDLAITRLSYKYCILFQNRCFHAKLYGIGADINQSLFRGKMWRMEEYQGQVISCAAISLYTLLTAFCESYFVYVINKLSKLIGNPIKIYTQQKHHKLHNDKLNENIKKDIQYINTPAFQLYWIIHTIYSQHSFQHAQ